MPLRDFFIFLVYHDNFAFDGISHSHNKSMRNEYGGFAPAIILHYSKT